MTTGACARTRDQSSQAGNNDAAVQRFQLALLVPAKAALQADAPVYAAWLLYASGLSRDTREAADRSASIERALEPALEPAQRQQLRGLLASIDGVGDMSAEREDGSRAR